MVTDGHIFSTIHGWAAVPMGSGDRESRLCRDAGDADSNLW